MENLMNVASYIYNRYENSYGECIDEMKLHKLLYFAQRESFIQKNEPLFDAVFYGWKYGPVLKNIRNAYQQKTFNKDISMDVIDRLQPIMDKVFTEYAGKDSWSLSRLTHGELSWKNSRKNIMDNENSDNPIAMEDISKDADRVRARRNALAHLGLA